MFLIIIKQKLYKSNTFSSKIMVRKTAKKKPKGKKKWISIVSPANFGEKEIGHSLVFEPENLLGRKLKVNLMLLTNDIRKQSTIIKFKINEIKNQCAHTVTLGYEISPLALKKTVRRKKNKLTQSFVMQTKNKVDARIKTLFVTHNKTTSVKIKQLQYAVLKEMLAFVEANNYDALVTNLLSGDLQNKIKAKLNKLMPMRYFDVYYISPNNRKNPYIITKEEIEKIRVKVGVLTPKPFKKRPFRKNAYSRHRRK